MFKKFRYQNRVNEKIADAGDRAFGNTTLLGRRDFHVHGSIMGPAVDAMYESADPVVTAQAAVSVFIEGHRRNADTGEVAKWSKILEELELMEREMRGVY